MHNEEEKEMRIRKESFAFLLIVRSGKRSCGRPAFVTIVSVLLLTAIIVTAVPESTRGQGENKEAAVGKDGYSISGRLLDKPGGKGVGGVTVSLSCEAGSATTADDGTYSITGLTPFSFSYWMTPAQSPGVWTDWIMVYLKDSDITDRDIYMTLPQSISGTVRDGKTGEPIAGAAIGISTEDGNRDEIQTDAQGKYLLYVRAREVVFSCGGKDGYCVLDENGKETDGLGKTITVGPGERIKGIDFELKWSPVFWGHVVYPDGSPASGVLIDAWVHWDNRGGRGGGYSNGRIFHITTDDQGRFGGGMLVNGRIPNTQRPWTMHEIAEAALRVDWSKKYWLKRMERLGEAIKEEGTVLTDLHGVVALPDQSMAGHFKGEVIPNTHRFKKIRIVLGKSAQVTLHVVDPNGKPLNGAWIDAEGPPEFSWWVPDFLPWYTGDFESLDDGRYVMRKLIPGISYHVNVHTPAQHVKTDQLVLKPGESRDVNTVTMNWVKEVSIAGLMNQVRMGNHVTHAYERKIAAYLLGRMGSQAKAAVPELIAQLKIDLIADTRCRIVEALGRIGDARALDVLREALKDENEDVRKAAAEAIQRIDEAQNAGSGDTKKVREEVSVHLWQRERVENIGGESIEQTIENLANFDDWHFAVTASSSGIGAVNILGKMGHDVAYVIALFRVRRLLEEGRSNRGAVVVPLKAAYKEALAGWPEARAERVAVDKTAISAGSGLTFSAPDAFAKYRQRALAATYLLAELQDHDSLPLLVQGCKVQMKWMDEFEPWPFPRTPVPIPFTLYAIHRLVSTLDPRHMDQEGLAAREAYLEWAGKNLPAPQVKVGTTWQSDYDESDTFLHIVDPQGRVLADQPKISLVKYPCTFQDGTSFQSDASVKEMEISDREKEWAGLLLGFAEAAMSEKQPAKNDEALAPAAASRAP